MGKSPRIASRNDGQASIFIALMVATLLSFFTFVVSVGVLVNAKINLQNAADLAAYSGAAVQARQLNSIGWLNYEMRRQFKRYLYRYFVVGSAQQAGFPAGNGGTAIFAPNAANPAGAYNVPIVCINFNAQDNICQLNEIPEIPDINVGFLDSIGQAFKNQLQLFTQVTQQNCGFISDVNQKALLFWLFNTTDEDIRQNNSFPQNIKFVIDQLAGIANGVGLVPKEILLARRIRTLESYVNYLDPDGGQFDLERISDITGGGGANADLAKLERPIQAFLSAINTLGEHTFNAQDIKMQEILPGGAGGKPLLNLEETKIDFDSLYLETAPVAGSNGCNQFARNIRVTQMPIGFHKPRQGDSDGSQLVFYAVQLKAKANLLFSPFGDIELKAYAAAKPFGSRIGPVIRADDFRTPRNPSFGGAPCPFGQCLIPNLDLVSTSAGGTELSFFNTQTLQGFFGATPKIPSPSGQPVINGSAIDYASFIAQGPNPVELGKYMIPMDIMDGAGNSLPPIDRKGGSAGGDPTYQMFRRQPDDGDPSQIPVPLLDIWAPLFDEAFNADAIKAELEPILTSSFPSAQNTKTILLDQIVSYVSKIRNQEGENGETFQIYRMPNPYVYPKSVTPLGVAAKIPTPGPMVVDATPAIRDSFPPTRNRIFKDLGRVGYSVKMVAFDYLFRNDLGWGNIESISAPGEILQDIKDSKKLRH